MSANNHISLGRLQRHFGQLNIIGKTTKKCWSLYCLGQITSLLIETYVHTKVPKKANPSMMKVILNKEELFKLQISKQTKRTFKALLILKMSLSQVSYIIRWRRNLRDHTSVPCSMYLFGFLCQHFQSIQISSEDHLSGSILLQHILHLFPYLCAP